MRRLLPVLFISALMLHGMAVSAETTAGDVWRDLLSDVSYQLVVKKHFEVFEQFMQSRLHIELHDCYLQEQTHDRTVHRMHLGECITRDFFESGRTNGYPTLISALAKLPFSDSEVPVEVDWRPGPGKLLGSNVLMNLYRFYRFWRNQPDIKDDANIFGQLVLHFPPGVLPRELIKSNLSINDLDCVVFSFKPARVGDELTGYIYDTEIQVFEVGKVSPSLVLSITTNLNPFYIDEGARVLIHGQSGVQR